MKQAIHYASRQLDQDIDTVVIVPEHPDYIVVGTYNLNKKQDTSDENEETYLSIPLRTGSLQILPFEAQTELSSTALSSCVTRKDLKCAVLDIHFHPAIPILLGAATSTGQIHFFSVSRSGNDVEQDAAFHIIELGIVTVYEPDEVESLPPITQFVWLPETRKVNKDAVSFGVTVTLIICDTKGKSKVIETRIPDLESIKTQHLQSTDSPPILSHKYMDIHNQAYNLEAWTVSTINLGIDDSIQTNLVLSGGDDHTLLISKYTADTGISLEENNPPVQIYNDKITHTAGIVSICPLQPQPLPSNDPLSTITTTTIIPILTGSYDETIRLFLLDSSTLSITHIASSDLSIPGGGTWRIKLLDEYTSLVIDEDGNQQYQNNWLFLISAMHAGVRIIRLTSTPTPSSLDLSSTKPAEKWTWTWQVETCFTQGHESMVYACTAKPMLQSVGEDEIEQVDDRIGNGNETKKEKGKKWSIISTSFYDRKICNWEWIDSAFPPLKN